MPLGANKAAIMGVAGTAAAGDVVLLSSQTASNSASLSFTSGITSTYGEYIFGFYNINPATDAANFTFQANATDSTSYDETITSAYLRAYHNESDSTTTLEYASSLDQAQGTAYQQIAKDVGNAAERSTAGILHLFSPSSTTYVKHYYSRLQCKNNVGSGIDAGGTYSVDFFTAGYFNVTGAIDEISFKMSSGNFDGTIKMWGVK